VTRPDPLAPLLRPASPAPPRAVFAAALRERLEAELGHTIDQTEGERMRGTTDSTTRITQLMPHLVLRGAAGAIDFYRAAFGAEEVGERLLAPDGSVAHAEIALGESIVSLSDESGEEAGPETIGGTPVRVSLYVDDVDRFAERAVAAGATVVYPVADQPYGLRGGRLRDPFGHLWIVHSPPAP
jgi:PhnB protein